MKHHPAITLVRITGDGSAASSYVISVSDTLSGTDTGEIKYNVGTTASHTNSYTSTTGVIAVGASMNLYVQAKDRAGNTKTVISTSTVPGVIVNGASINTIATTSAGTALTVLDSKVYSS